MWEFYRPIVKRMFTLFLDKTDRWQNVIGILLILLSVVTTANQAIGKSITDNWRGWPAWYGVFPLVFMLLYGLAVAVYENDQTAKKRFKETDDVRQRLEEQLVPKLDMIFSETDSSCAMPFSADGEQYLLYRVGIVNLSNHTIDGVKVTLRRFMPQNAPFLPAELLLMNRSRAEAITGVSINKGQGPSIYANVVARRLHGDETDQITIQYANAGLSRAFVQIPPGTYGFTLRVEGRGVVQERERTFTVMASGSSLAFYPADVAVSRA